MATTMLAALKTTWGVGESYEDDFVDDDFESSSFEDDFVDDVVEGSGTDP